MYTNDDPQVRLKRFLEYYERGVFGVNEACIWLYDIAASIEPKELLEAIPEKLQKQLESDATGELMSREDYFIIEGATVTDIESYSRNKKVREDRQYQGLVRLHKYFSERNKEAT